MNIIFLYKLKFLSRHLNSIKSNFQKDFLMHQKKTLFKTLYSFYSVEQSERKYIYLPKVSKKTSKYLKNEVYIYKLCININVIYHFRLNNLLFNNI